MPTGSQQIFVDAGFAQVLDNNLTVLTEHALAPEEIDRDAERHALAEAQQRRAVTPEEHESRRRDIARATVKIKLAI
jgi:F0F1-type ATP synthase epsilon subunit